MLVPQCRDGWHADNDQARTPAPPNLLFDYLIWEHFHVFEIVD